MFLTKLADVNPKAQLRDRQYTITFSLLGKGQNAGSKSPISSQIQKGQAGVKVTVKVDQTLAELGRASNKIIARLKTIWQGESERGLVYTLRVS